MKQVSTLGTDSIENLLDKKFEVVERPFSARKWDYLRNQIIDAYPKAVRIPKELIKNKNTSAIANKLKFLGYALHRKNCGDSWIFWVDKLKTKKVSQTHNHHS